MKRWVIRPRKIDDIVEQLLINRDIKKEDWDSFLSPDFEKGLHDPFLMKGMKKAVDRLGKALAARETVGIFGDYDADGIPGVALLYESLLKLGLKVIPYIPKREQGYGLNKEGIDLFAKNGAKLMITIDLGIREVTEIDYAREKGLETIVLDHHEPGGQLPEAIIVNPKQKGDKYPFKELAGCGVAFKFIQAVSQKNPKVSGAFLKWLLDFVAISTICDVVPLVGENRIFAKYGLIVLKKTRRLGLKKLYEVAGIDCNSIDVYTVGFQIGPRLNAPGRMDHANESFYLLISRDEKESLVLAKKLDAINRKRQEELDRVLKEAKEKVLKELLHQKRMILVDGDGWPHGIIGLVAGKLMEEYNRPVIVFEKRLKDFRGSARSISAYNIIEALEESKDLLTSYGGHAKAAGLTLEHQHMSSLYDKLLEIADKKMAEEDLIARLEIDGQIKNSEINYRLVNDIKKFEPFGLGNPRPIFTLKDAKVESVRTIGRENKHLKMKIDGFDAVAFDMADLFQLLKEKGKVDVAFSVHENIWNGNRSLQLKVCDFAI